VAKVCSGSDSERLGFKLMTGVDMTHVPYRGGAPAITDLIAGQVQVLFISPLGLIEYIRAVKLRGLAVTSAARRTTLVARLGRGPADAAL
jgi:tripartite-type tricarboxylate transporter receptor subunit TctC